MSRDTVHADYLLGVAYDAGDHICPTCDEEMDLIESDPEGVEFECRNARCPDSPNYDRYSGLLSNMEATDDCDDDRDEK